MTRSTIKALGDGWAWDDLAAGYAAPGGALQFNENVVKVVVQARGEAGQPAAVTLDPANSGLTLSANVGIAPEHVVAGGRRLAIALRHTARGDRYGAAGRARLRADGRR